MRYKTINLKNNYVLQYLESNLKKLESLIQRKPIGVRVKKKQI